MQYMMRNVHFNIQMRNVHLKALRGQVSWQKI